MSIFTLKDWWSVKIAEDEEFAEVAEDEEFVEGAEEELCAPPMRTEIRKQNPK